MEIYGVTPKGLIDEAKKAMKMAYAPYSDFCVGAALLTRSGRVFTGCNIENVSFTPTVCAERVAIFKALSEGERDFVAIAVVGGKNGEIKGAVSPCGVCRQVMAEFCLPDELEVYLGTETEEYERYTLGELLPHSFGKNKI